jgi:hypothetical protein
MASALDVVQGTAAQSKAKSLAAEFVGQDRERALVTMDGSADHLVALAVLAPVLHMFSAVDVVVSGLWDDTFVHDIKAVVHVLNVHCGMSSWSTTVYAGWTAVCPGAPPGLVDRSVMPRKSARRVVERMQATPNAYNSVFVFGELDELDRIVAACGSKQALSGAALALARMPIRSLCDDSYVWRARHVYAIPRLMQPFAKDKLEEALRLAHLVTYRLPDIARVHHAYVDGGYPTSWIVDEATMMAAALLLPTDSLRPFGLVATNKHCTWWFHVATDTAVNNLRNALYGAAADALVLPPKRCIQ